MLELLTEVVNFPFLLGNHLFKLLRENSLDLSHRELVIIELYTRHNGLHGVTQGL